MLRYILGGVALGATGYGLAKWFDEDCNKRDKPPFVEIFSDDYYLLDKFETIKQELYDTSIVELQTALNEIDGLDFKTIIKKFRIKNPIPSTVETTDDIKQQVEKYTTILQKAKKYIDSKLDLLDSIIVKENKFEKYSDEDKQLVYTLIELFELIDKSAPITIVDDNIEFSRDVKRAFLKIEKIIG